MAEKHKEELILATIGPETNIAMALRREPRLRRWIREITIMGGSTTTGNWSPAAEFNIACDVEAAAAVFESGIPLRMVGYNITRRTGSTRATSPHARQQAARRGGDRRPDGVYLGRQRRDVSAERRADARVCAIVPYVYPDLITFLHTSARDRNHRDLFARHDGVRPAPPDGSARHAAQSARSRMRSSRVDARSRALIAAVLDTLLEYPVRADRPLRQ